MRMRVLRLLPSLMLVAACGVAGCFPHKAGPRLAHFDLSGPTEGAPAPSFKLLDLYGKKVSLESLIGEKPIVLQLGSHSCPVYRYRRHGMRDLHEEYKDSVHFLVVYTIEAHPLGSKSPYADEEWLTWINRLTGVKIIQPQTREERLDQAGASHDKLNLVMPMVVDDMDNQVWRLYGAASSPAFVIDQRGVIVSRQVWLDPEEIRDTLDRLLGRVGP